jgi:hypothetical protein
MKKVLAILAAIFMLFSLCSCGESSTSSTQATEAAQATSAEAAASETAPSENGASDLYSITYANATYYTDSIGTPYAQTIIEITNTSDSDLYLSTCSFDLQDSSGNLVKCVSMATAYPDVIAPNEKGYVYDETLLDSVPSDTNLTVDPHLSVEKATIDNIRYETSNVSLSTTSYGSLAATGYVENTTSEDGDLVYVTVVLYDANNTPIGLLFTILTNTLAAGDKVGFEADAISLPSSVTADSVANFTVYAYPSQMQF